MDYERKYHQLAREIDDDRGETYRIGINVLRFNVEVFVKSTEPAEQLLRKFKKCDYTTSLFDTRSPGKMRSAIINSTSAFVSFLFSYKTFTDCNGLDVSRYFPDEKSEYKNKVSSAFKGRSDLSFIRDLRNYIAHYSLPVLCPRIIYRTSGNLTDAFVDGRKLINSGYKWNTEAREFLEKNHDIDVLGLAVNAKSDVVKFNHEFINKTEVKYSDDITRVARMKKAKAMLLRKMKI